MRRKMRMMRRKEEDEKEDEEEDDVENEEDENVTHRVHAAAHDKTRRLQYSARHSHRQQRPLP